MPLADAVAGAIRGCVRQGILADFLGEHGSEVMNMLLEEWSLDEAKEVWRDEGREEGFELAVARYQPVIEDKNREISVIKREIGNKDRLIGELRRKLREAGID
jgi:hypothetical protein